jgi:predicted Zn-dependent peptidase
MSSRLFQEIRERRGLAYSVYSFASAFDDSGLFGVYMGTEADQAGTALEVVIDEARKLTGSISDAEMARARTQLKAGLLMSLESTSSRVEQRARQMTLFNRPLSPGEIVERIEAVNVGAVCAMAARLLDSPPTLTVVGPAQSVPGIAEIAERLSR